MPRRKERRRCSRLHDEGRCVGCVGGWLYGVAMAVWRQRGVGRDVGRTRRVLTRWPLILHPSAPALRFGAGNGRLALPLKHHSVCILASGCIESVCVGAALPCWSVGVPSPRMSLCWMPPAMDVRPLPPAALLAAVFSTCLYHNVLSALQVASVASAVATSASCARFCYGSSSVAVVLIPHALACTSTRCTLLCVGCTVRGNGRRFRKVIYPAGARTRSIGVRTVGRLGQTASVWVDTHGFGTCRLFHTAVSCSVWQAVPTPGTASSCCLCVCTGCAVHGGMLWSALPYSVLTGRAFHALLRWRGRRWSAAPATGWAFGLKSARGVAPQEPWFAAV